MLNAIEAQALSLNILFVRLYDLVGQIQSLFIGFLFHLSSVYYDVPSKKSFKGITFNNARSSGDISSDPAHLWEAIT